MLCVSHRWYPSLIKGGAAGGGYAQVVPMDDLNLHFTGDFHAITSANNLLAAMLDNHIQQGNKLNIDPKQIVWKRCVDMNDRVLRNITVGLGRKVDGVTREDHFIITVASEIMAILCLADNMKDLKERLGRIIVAYTYEGKPVTAKEIKAVGAMAALLKRCDSSKHDSDVREYTGTCAWWYHLPILPTAVIVSVRQKNSFEISRLHNYGGWFWR